MYADDTNLTYAGKDINDINDCLNPILPGGGGANCARPDFNEI